VSHSKPQDVRLQHGDCCALLPLAFPPSLPALTVSLPSSGSSFSVQAIRAAYPLPSLVRRASCSARFFSFSFFFFFFFLGVSFWGEHRARNREAYAERVQHAETYRHKQKQTGNTTRRHAQIRPGDREEGEDEEGGREAGGG